MFTRRMADNEASGLQFGRPRDNLKCDKQRAKTRVQVMGQTAETRTQSGAACLSQVALGGALALGLARRH